MAPSAACLLDEGLRARPAGPGRAYTAGRLSMNPFPTPLDAYPAAAGASFWQTLGALFVATAAFLFF